MVENNLTKLLTCFDYMKWNLKKINDFGEFLERKDIRFRAEVREDYFGQSSDYSFFVSEKNYDNKNKIRLEWESFCENNK